MARRSFGAPIAQRVPGERRIKDSRNSSPRVGVLAVRSFRTPTIRSDSIPLPLPNS